MAGIEVAQATITVTPVLEGAQQSLTQQMTAAAGPAGASAGKAAGTNVAKSMGKSMTGAGKTMSKAVTAPIVGIGVAATAAWKEVDAGLDIIVEKTGATGKSLSGMETILKNIATTIPTDFNTAAEAIGEVNTRFGTTGAELEKLSTQFVKFAKINGVDVSSSVDTVQKALSAFGLGASDAEGLLDTLTATGQKTGASVETLSKGLVQNGTAFQEMGLSADQAVVMMGQLETSGANSETVMQGLRKALKNAAKDGVPLDQALGQLQDSIMNGTNGMDGLTAAYELFGKSGDQIYGAIKNGTINFKDLATAAGDTGGTVSDTFESTLSPMEKFQTTMNDLKILGADIVNSAAPALSDVMADVGDAVKTAADAWAGLSPEMQETIIKCAGIAAVAGPLLTIGGSLVGTIGSIGAGLVSVISGLIGTTGAAAASTAPVAASATSFQSLAGSALQMVAAGAAFLMVAGGMSLLADAAIRVASAGVPAIGVLAGMAVGIGALMYVASSVGPALTAGAVGILAFGASMLMIGAGVAVASAGITLIIGAITNLVSVVSSNADSINSIVSNVGETVGGVVTDISDGITQVIDAISGGVSGVLDSVAGIFDSMGKAALNAGTGFQKLAGSIKSLSNVGIVKIAGTLGAAADGVKKISSAAGSAASGASNMSNLAKSVTKLGTAGKTTTKSMTTLGTTVKKGMTTASNAIKGAKLDTSMKSMMDKVSKTAKSSINSLKSTFSGTTFSFNHHIAVPHFSMSGSFNAQTKSTPTVHTRWYAKAAEMGARFTVPTIIGVGDATQPEILLGENKLKELTGAGKNTPVVNYITVNGAEDPKAWASKFARQLKMEVRLGNG